MPNKPNRFYNFDELRMLARVFELVRKALADLYGTEMSAEQAAELGTIILERFSAGD
jgi:hypothetical protein